jgi:ABC-type oligopeptide transport system substrate-binding subunit
MFKKLHVKTPISNRTILIYICFLLISAYFSNVANAQDTTLVAAEASEATAPVKKTAQYGVSMHDTPALQLASEHLPYVNPDAPKGGTLKQAAIGTFDNLNPFNIKGIASAQGLNLIYDRLTLRSWDEPFTLYPLIAQDVQFSEDRLNIDIILNPNAKFADGSPITTDDVVFSFNTLKESGRPNMRNIYKLVTEVNVADKQHVSFALDASSNRETAMIIAMMPVLSKAFWAERDFNETLVTPPVSNGPYKIKTVDLGRKITYERDENYWANDLAITQGLHNFDDVTYEYYRDDDVALMAFNAGDLNYRREGNITKWITGYEEENAHKQKVIKEEISHRRPGKAHSLIFNTRRQPLDDIAVRKALFSLVDFNWVNTNFYHNKKDRALTMFPNSRFHAVGTFSQQEAIAIGNYRRELPEGALAGMLPRVNHTSAQQVRKHYKYVDFLLRQSGWVVEDGKRVNRDDKRPLSFEIIVNNPEDEKLALAFKRSVKRLGIKPVIRRLDSAAFQGRIQNYDYDAVISYWSTSLSPGTEQYLYWGCEAAKTPSQWNYAGICDPAIEHLLAGIVNTTTTEDLVNHMKVLDRILMNSYIAIPLFHTNRDYVAHTQTIAKPSKKALYGVIIESWWEKQKN